MAPALNIVSTPRLKILLVRRLIATALLGIIL
jgi:hypothetical protein